MSDQTLFSKIIAGEIPSHRVASGDNWYAFLDIFPRRQGHTLVVPHQPVTNLQDLNEFEITGLFTGVQIVQSKLTEVFNTVDFTVCIHDGPLAGQEVPHVHVHVIPRTPGDGGRTLMAMWPDNRTIGEPNHQALASLASKLDEVR
ncbi:MAG: HIT family hydrolase [Euryarchaeota archaeon]|nr:HIT family hydrolase [Euryarchaeota archaeon]DAC31348.1 MAG TPA: HIT family protein [Candidatus Poseidoniales archaeon]HII44691.1 HIT family protein [Candidatus Poseidoniaceae archaeon]|tara:strand:+ start:5467 stop:5901 length:435 start_codon:yes stop_codon:yes gene_type:complete